MYQNKDVFEGLSVPRAIAKFAIPTVLSQLVTLVYNLADTFFVGHTNDPSQVAALTLSSDLGLSGVEPGSSLSFPPIFVQATTIDNRIIVVQNNIFFINSMSVYYSAIKPQ